MKKVLFILLLSLVLLAGAAWQGWQRYNLFLQTPLLVRATGQVFEVVPGATGAHIVGQLTQRGLTRAGWEWRLLMRLEPKVYRVGEYRLEAGMLPQGFLEKISTGEVVQYRLTLVEGWTFQQFAAALASNEVLKHDLDLESPSQWPLLSSDLGFEHPEGWFLPETYQFTRGDSERDILVRAHAAMKLALESAWASRDDDLPIDSPYELLILASIIERETSLDEERDQVAGVFVRRLKKGMRLQTDPTVIYGLGDAYDGDIRRRDLKTDTPYNTYTRHGLTPTPISMPGRASLMAAARPAPGDTFYFVANGQGGHTFSATLEEHQKAVKILIENY